jgi:hypothetical protein
MLTSRPPKPILERHGRDTPRHGGLTFQDLWPEAVPAALGSCRLPGLSWRPARYAMVRVVDGQRLLVLKVSHLVGSPAL